MEQSGKLGTIGNELNGRIQSKKRGFDDLTAGENIPIQFSETSSPRRDSCSSPSSYAQKSHRETRDELAVARFTLAAGVILQNF